MSSAISQFAHRKVSTFTFSKSVTEWTELVDVEHNWATRCSHRRFHLHAKVSGDLSSSVASTSTMMALV